MECVIRRSHAIHNDLRLTIAAEELASVSLSFPHAAMLNNTFGIVRHDVPEWWQGEQGLRHHSYDPLWQDGVREGHVRDGWYPRGDGLNPYKPIPAEHLEGLGFLDDNGNPKRRLIMVGNRNLGNNWHCVAWHEGWAPRRLFALHGEPITERTYTCLVWWKNRGPSAETLRFDEDGGVYTTADDADVSKEIEWATYGQQPLRDGRIIPIQEMIAEYYDLRHVFSYDENVDDDRREMWGIWRAYPDGFEARMLEALHAGRPRSRYLHSSVALGHDGSVSILQRHGSPEESAYWAREALNARDCFIFDNGGSVFTWAWWLLRGIDEGGERLWGGYLHSAPDFRPPTISALVFTLHGPVAYDERPGSVAFMMA